jgi:indole-3-glycerol phosphate synthase
LRKEFIIDSWQLAESAALGSDAVLLMAACFDSKDQFADLYHRAIELGLEVLVEIHSEDEWRFVESVNPKLVGINNRDFMSPDLSVDLATTEKLAPIVGADKTLVSESGIGGSDDIRRLIDLVDGFLIGSTFMAEDDPGGAVARIIGEL